jgi:hypothetical protein
MPLPEGGAVPWPPTEFQTVQATLRTWGAWYSSDPEQLTAVYGANVASQVAPSMRAAQLRGGISGKLARLWWGTPTPLGESSTKLHIPVASDIASMSADLLFGEAPELELSEGASTQAVDRLQSYVDRGLFSDLREGAEIQSALGGVYLRAVWDPAVADRPWLSPAHPDAAVPEWRWNKLAAVTFWSIVETSGQKVLRHLERHEPGVILHALFEGTTEVLGRRVPMTESPTTAAIVPSLTEGDAIPTGIPMLTAVYVPNVRPNRIWRNLPVAQNLGRSDYAGSEPMMDALDETWSSWMRDVRLGKARLVVPQTVLTSAGPGQGATFDVDKELFVGLNLSPEGDDDTITQVQFAIRVEEHERTAQALVEHIVRSAGYSMQTFSGETEGTGVTATEIAAREKRTLSTRDRKVAYWTTAMAEALEMLMALDSQHFSAGIEPERPAVEFPDAVSPDPSNQAVTLKTLADAKLISTETGIKILHPEWDEDQVAAEMSAILGPELARQAQAIGAMGDALTKMGTAESLGTVGSGTTDSIMRKVMGVAPDQQ